MTEWDDITREFSAGNVIEGAPANIIGKANVRASGVGNRLIIEDGVTVAQLSLEFIGGGNTIILRSGSKSFGRFIVGDGSTIEIGERSWMTKACWFQAIEGKSIRVGRKCLFADVRIRTSDAHSVVSTTTGKRLNLAKDVVIEDAVWIAEKAHLYKGVRIGTGSVIGSHSVVFKSIPSYCLAVGVPAKVVRTNVTWRKERLGKNGDPSAIIPLKEQNPIAEKLMYAWSAFRRKVAR